MIFDWGPESWSSPVSIMQISAVKMSILSFSKILKHSWIEWTPKGEVNEGHYLNIQIEIEAKSLENAELCDMACFSLLFNTKSTIAGFLYGPTPTINLTCLQGSVILLGLRHYFYWDRRIAPTHQLKHLIIGKRNKWMSKEDASL